MIRDIKLKGFVRLPVFAPNQCKVLADLSDRCCFNCVGSLEASVSNKVLKRFGLCVSAL